MKRRSIVVVGLALAGTAMAGCSSSPPPPTRPAALPSPPEVVVKMQEYGFEFDSDFAGLPAGRVVFRMVNTGQEIHIPTIIPLGDDVPPIDVQVRSSDRRIVQPLAGVNDRLPGEMGTFAVDLVPGQRYAFVCYGYTRDEVAHSQKGMTWEGRAGAPRS